MPLPPISTFVPAVTKLLGNRSDVAALAPEQIGNAIIELSNDYPFEELRETGPTVQFQVGVDNYPSAYFAVPASGGNPQHALSKVLSWFFYLQVPQNLTANPAFGVANPGYNLIFRDMADLEVLANTITLPQFWSQEGSDPTTGIGTLYVAAVPNQTYYTYMRYQFLHPVSYPIPLAADLVMLPQNWFDIIEYAACERIALQLRMQDVADRYHTKLFGDPMFEATSGAKGKPGLIFRRVSQTQKNQSRSTRSVRIIGRRGY